MEPTPIYHVDAEPPTPVCPTYEADRHFAKVGRELTLAAGYALDQRPPAIIVRLALRRQGLLTEQEQHDH